MFGLRQLSLQGLGLALEIQIFLLKPSHRLVDAAAVHRGLGQDLLATQLLTLHLPEITATYSIAYIQGSLWFNHLSWDLEIVLLCGR